MLAGGPPRGRVRGVAAVALGQVLRTRLPGGALWRAIGDQVPLTAYMEALPACVLLMVPRL